MKPPLSILLPVRQAGRPRLVPNWVYSTTANALQKPWQSHSDHTPQSPAEGILQGFITIGKSIKRLIS